MSNLAAFALGMLTVCVVCLTFLALLYVIDIRKGKQRFVERRGDTPNPEPPTAVITEAGPSIVPISVSEVREAEAETRLLRAVENVPMRGESHIFAVDSKTAALFTNPTTDSAAS